MIFAIAATREFPLLKELARAKYYRDQRELGRLMPLCRQQFVSKYGEDGKKMFQEVYYGLYFTPEENHD